MGYNKTILEGNLTEDPTIRYSQDGTAMSSAKIAVNERFKKKDGSKGETVLYVKLEFFGKSAEIFSQYCRKGSRILVDGKLKNNNWEDGQGNKRYDFAVKVENMQMLDSRTDAPQQQQQSQHNIQSAPNEGGEYIDRGGIRQTTIDIDDQIIPF